MKLKIFIPFFIGVFTILLSCKNANVTKESNNQKAVSEIDTAQQKKIKDTLPAITSQVMETYYKNGINDDNIKLLRKKLNQFNAGKITKEDDQIMPSALDSMTLYGKKYLDSKFAILQATKNPYGGKIFYIVFLNSPDKMFCVWIKEYAGGGGSIISFDKKEISPDFNNLIQNNKIFLNPKYGF